MWIQDEYLKREENDDFLLKTLLKISLILEISFEWRVSDEGLSMYISKERTAKRK